MHTVDGYVKMIGELVPSDVVVIEGIRDVHGKEDVWLLYVGASESTLIGFAIGWHAVG